jgi:transposase
MARRTLREVVGRGEDGDHPPVEGTDLPLRAALSQLGVARSTFYGWHQRSVEEGFDGLKDKQPARRAG